MLSAWLKNNSRTLTRPDVTQRQHVSNSVLQLDYLNTLYIQGMLFANKFYLWKGTQMNFKKGDRVIVKSQIENLFGGAPCFTPDFGDLGEVCSAIEIMGCGAPAVRVKFKNDLLWWVHPKHLKLVEHMAEEQQPANGPAPL